MMDLSIIIVSWNTAQLLMTCLQSIQTAQEADPKISSEVIVVDNASSDGSAALVSTQFPYIKLIRNKENVGFARANNQGLAISSGRYVMFLNSDTTVAPGTLTAICSFMDQHPNVGVLGPLICNPDGTLQESAFKAPTFLNSLGNLLFGNTHQRLLLTFTNHYYDLRRPTNVGWVSGACLVIRRDCANLLGGWDESYFLYSEDVDICLRARQHGWDVVFAPIGAITHLRNQSSIQIREQAIQSVYLSRIQLRNRHWGALRCSLYCLFTSILLGTRAVMFWLVSKSNLQQSQAASSEKSIKWQRYRYLAIMHLQYFWLTLRGREAYGRMLNNS